MLCRADRRGSSQSNPNSGFRENLDFVRTWSSKREIVIKPLQIKSGDIRMNPRRFALALSLLAGMAGTVFALPQDSGAKQDMKDAGHDTKNAAKDTGSATKKTAKKTANGAKKATNKGAAKTDQGAQKVENKTAPKPQ
jgi:hypothetical protein